MGKRVLKTRPGEKDMRECWIFPDALSFVSGQIKMEDSYQANEEATWYFIEGIVLFIFRINLQSFMHYLKDNVNWFSRKCKFPSPVNSSAS